MGQIDTYVVPGILFLDDGLLDEAIICAAPTILVDLNEIQEIEPIHVCPPPPFS